MDSSPGCRRLNQQFYPDGDGQSFSSPVHGFPCGHVLAVLGWREQRGSGEAACSFCPVCSTGTSWGKGVSPCPWDSSLCPREPHGWQREARSAVGSGHRGDKAEPCRGQVMVAAGKRWLFQQWRGAVCKQEAIKSHSCTREKTRNKLPVFGDEVGRGEIFI